MKLYLYLGLVLFFFSCNNNEELILTPISDPNASHLFIIEKLTKDYNQLPEKAIAISEDSSTYAQYAQPTTKYRHGILGDVIEAEKLVLYTGGRFYETTLSESYLFEDIRPRLYDVDNDQQLEIITIRSHTEKGAGIVIYKLYNGKLEEYATVAEIGIKNRWLNIASIQDLNNDGIVEIAWIETPHIGGILKVASITRNNIQAFAEIFGYSNHAIGETNLCLSVSTQQMDKKTLYVPNQHRNTIYGLRLIDNIWIPIDSIPMSIDFKIPLKDQYNFSNVTDESINCIF